MEVSLSELANEMGLFDNAVFIGQLTAISQFATVLKDWTYPYKAYMLTLVLEKPHQLYLGFCCKPDLLKFQSNSGMSQNYVNYH